MWVDDSAPSLDSGVLQVEGSAGLDRRALWLDLRRTARTVTRGCTVSAAAARDDRGHAHTRPRRIIRAQQTTKTAARSARRGQDQTTKTAARSARRGQDHSCAAVTGA
jgi:hypothetical protein